MERETGLQGGWESSFGPCAKQIYFRRDPKADSLRIESGPSWRACFWSLHFVRCAEILQAAMCAECQAWSYLHKQHPRQDSWTGKARICVSNFSCLWGSKSIFFCSNALIALARSLCKCLLAVLITASEADAVTGFLVCGASQYDTIPRREKKNTATKPTQASNKTTRKQHKKKHKNTTRTKTSQSGMTYPKVTMKRNDQATYVPRPEQVILEATVQSQTY